MTTADTRTQFIRAATRLFSEKGFYGASIAAIGQELGLTKQALIHHFGTKEKLYGLVLAQIAARFADDIAAAKAAHEDPAKQLETFFAQFCEKALADPEDVRLILREIMDNRERAKGTETWYLRSFLDDLTQMVLRTPQGQGVSPETALTRAYQLLGAMSYFAVSGPTLLGIMGGDSYRQIRAAFPEEFQRSFAAIIGQEG